MPNYPYDQLGTPLDIPNLDKANGNWAKIAADIASVASASQQRDDAISSDYNEKLLAQKNEYTGRLDLQYSDYNEKLNIQKSDYSSRFVIQKSEYTNLLNNQKNEYTVLLAEQSERIDNIVSEISEDAFDLVMESAVINWKTPVANFSSISTTYPNPVVGDSVQTLDDDKLYRFNGSAWVYFQKQINGQFSSHIANSEIHVTKQDKDFLRRNVELQWLNSFKRLENEMDSFIAPSNVDEPTISYSTSEPQIGSTISGKLMDLSSLTRSGTTATGVTLLPHGLEVGSVVTMTISGATNSAGDSNSYNGKKNVTITDHRTFTYTITNTNNPATATGVIVATLQADFTAASDSVYEYNVPRSSLRSDIGPGNATWMNGFTEELGPNPYAVEFGCSEDVFEFATRRMYGFRILVNGYPISAKPLKTTDASYPMFLVKVKFKSAKNRTIRIEFQKGQPFVGVWTPNAKSLYKPPVTKRPRCLMLGDSFGEGTGAVNERFGSITAYIGYKMGWEMINGSLGSTGITTVGVQGAGNDYTGRLRRLYSRYKPDIVMVLGSVNDAGNITKSNAGALLDEISLLCSNAKIVAFGPVWVNTSIPPANVTSAQNLRDAAFDRRIPYLDGGIGLGGAPIWINASNNATYYNGTRALATATVSGGAVTGFDIQNAGLGYDFHDVPTVVLSNGGGAGATARATMNYSVTDIILLNGGSGYTSPPTVTLSNGAKAITRLSGNVVSSCTVTEEGGNYITPPVVSFVGGGGTGATAKAIIEGGRVLRIEMTNGGSGYTSTPTAVLSSSQNDATATATIENGKVVGLTITSAGSLYTSCPRVTFAGGGTSAGGAEAVAFVSGIVSGIELLTPGSGYTSPPTVTIPHPTNNDVTHPKETGHQMLAIRFANQLAQGGI